MSCPSGVRWQSCWRHLAGLALLALPSSEAYGGGLPVTDLTLGLEVLPTLAIYPAETLATLRFTVRNEGPDPSPASRVAMPPFWTDGPNSQVVIGPIGGTAPCEYSAIHFDALPGFHGALVPSIQFPAIAVGGSVTCDLGLRVLESGRGDFLAQGAVDSVAISGLESVDPDLSDNFDEFLLTITPAGAPAPVTDLSVAMAMEEFTGTIFPPGTNAPFLISVTNEGPESARGATVSIGTTVSEAADHSIAVVSGGAQYGDNWCIPVIDPGATEFPLTRLASIRFPGLAPGETAICRARLLVLDDAAGRFVITGTLLPQPEVGLPTEDPNLDDNTALLAGLVSLGVSPNPLTVPVASPAGLLLLVLVVVAFGSIASRRSSR